MKATSDLCITMDGERLSRRIMQYDVTVQAHVHYPIGEIFRNMTNECVLKNHINWCVKAVFSKFYYFISIFIFYA